MISENVQLWQHRVDGRHRMIPSFGHREYYRNYEFLLLSRYFRCKFCEYESKREVRIFYSNHSICKYLGVYTFRRGYYKIRDVHLC